MLSSDMTRLERLKNEFERRLEVREFINPRYLVNIGYNSREIQRCIREGEHVHPDYLEPLRHNQPLPDEIKIVEPMIDEETKVLAIFERAEMLIPSLVAKAKVTHNIFSGFYAYDLWQSRGIPVDILEIMLEDYGIVVDMDAYQRAFEEHQNVSRSGMGGSIF